MSFLQLAAKTIERFRLFDIGCAGGIDPIWRLFPLQAIAVDASASECRNLAERETNPEVSYVAAFVESKSGAPPFVVRLWDRLSSKLAMDLKMNRLKTTEAKIRHNAWEATELAERVVSAADLLRERGWDSFDYLKLDVDGPDFDILRSINLDGVLAAHLEVNFIGTADPNDHSFHNTDRHMRQQGFALFKLQTRTYSSKALPARFAIDTPAQTVSGRVFQGDAFYARDAVEQPTADPLKLASILSAWELPDCAAEILLEFRDRLPIDVDLGLDLLAAQMQGDSAMKYREYIAEFMEQSPRFYPPVMDRPEPAFWQRLRSRRYYR